jgi:F0F1-type ATP synthase membrane subunit b/b'
LAFLQITRLPDADLISACFFTSFFIFFLLFLWFCYKLHWKKKISAKTNMTYKLNKI